MLKRLSERARSSTVARNAGWMFLGQGVSIVNQGLYFLLLARLLGVGEYGALVGAGAAVGMLSQYSSVGSGFVFLRYVGATRSRFSEYWGSILVLTVSVGLLLTLVLHILGRVLLPHTPVMLLLSLALADCVCSQLTLCCGQIFQTYERMRITAILNMATNVARMLLAGCSVSIVQQQRSGHTPRSQSPSALLQPPSSSSCGTSVDRHSASGSCDHNWARALSFQSLDRPPLPTTTLIRRCWAITV
jgi:O-antigen/teichoic acid export membrane protein